jgi:phosphoserine phosphatase
VGELVAVDVEGTLTSGFGGFSLGRFLARHGRGRRYWGLFLSRVLPGIVLGRLRIKDRQRLRETWVVEIARLLDGMSDADLAAMGEWVVEHALWPKRREHVVAEIERHREAGRRVALLSGNYQVVVDGLARRLGVEGYGTALGTEHGVATGRAGPVNTGAAKTARLKEILDIAMLELAKEAVAVCPDATLRRMAEEQGWRILAP